MCFIKDSKVEVLLHDIVENKGVRISEVRKLSLVLNSFTSIILESLSDMHQFK